MKLIKKIIFVCLLGLLPLSGFTATNNIIRVGIFDEYESESSKHELGLQKEFFARLMIAEGKKTVFINAPRSKIMSMVKNGKIDVLPFVEYDEALEEYLDFSNEKIVSSWDVLLVDKSANYKKPEDIDGLRIGLIAEMPSSFDFVKYIDSLDLHFFPIYSRNLDELYRAVENKEVDAIVIPSFAESGFFDGRIGLVRSGFFFNTSSMKVATLDGDPDGLMPLINENLASLKSMKFSNIDRLFEKHKRVKKHWLDSSIFKERMDIIIIILFVFIGIIIGLFFIFRQPKQNTSLSRSVLAKMTTVAVIFLVVTLSIEAVGLYRVYVNDKKKLENDVLNYSKERLELESKWLRLLIDNIRYSVRRAPLETQKEHVAQMLDHILNSPDFHFFITNYDGVKITGKSAGKDISDATDKDGMKVIQEQIAIAKNGSGFLNYHMAPEFDHGDKDYEKLGYFYGMDEFRWVVGVGMNVGNNENVLIKHKKYLDQILLNQFLLIAVVMVLLFLVVVMIGYRFASLLKKNRQRIDKYFEEAFQKDITINENEFYYKEFRYIVSVFNEMLINQQRSKRALQEQEENLRITFASIGDAVITVDTGSVVTRMNPVASKLTGWGVDEGVGQNLNDIFKVINFNTRAPMKTPVDRVLRTGETSGLDKHTALISRESKEYLIDDSASPIKDQNGVIVGVILVFRDVTDEYKLERKINDQQKDESIGLLAGGVAHDFNNILQIILGHAELIKFKYCRNIEQDYFDTIENAGLKGKNLVQQLLQFSKKEFYTPVELNVSDAVRSNEMLLSHAVQANIQFDLELDDYLPNVMLDQTQFSQLLMNLVINARTAIGDKNGRILVKTFMPDKKHGDYFVNPTREENADFIAVSVSDTGSGIPDAIIEKIFEPFFTTKGEATGTGMGLAAVYGIIKHHGGDIRVSKSIDWSTIFTIYIPVVKEENLIQNVEASGDRYDVVATFSQPWNILVAEDDQVVQKLTVSTLEQMGGVVFAADNGKDAVDLFVSNREVIDILVFDIVMPKLNGVEAYKIIRAYNPNTPVVFVTGYSDNKLSELANEDPSLYLCLRKPCKKIELYTAVVNLLEKKNV